MPHSQELEGKSSAPQHVLVTGATGHQGGGLARVLLQRGHRVRALTRKPDGPAAGELKKLGAEVVAGDLGERSSIERAARGVDAAFLVATPYEMGPDAETRFGTTGLDAMKAAGVPYVVYSSVGDADRRTGIPHFESKARIEEHLKDLGLKHSVVAPVFFSENLFAPWLAAGLAQGVFATGILPTRKIQVISLPELAEFTALAVEGPKAFDGKRINVASDEPMLSEMTADLSTVLNKKLHYQAVPLEQIRAQSEDMATMYDWFNREGYTADIRALRRDYPQVHWKSFREWAATQNWSQALSASG